MDLPIEIEDKPEVPFYRRLCDALRKAILDGKLKPGEFLPSSRQLAERLSVSRVTVVRSYEELLSQGYLEAAVGMGTMVSRTLESRFQLQGGAVEVSTNGDETEEKHRPLRLSSFGRRLLQTDSEEYTSTFFEELNFGAPPLDCLPVKQWRQALLKQANLIDEDRIEYDHEAFGYMPLREAIAQYLRRRRGVACTADQVALFGGAQHVLNQISRVLIDPDSAVAIESTGYCDARQAFLSQRARLHPITVDADGMRVDELRNIEEELRLVFLSPCHHTPSGAILSNSRREALLDWANETGTIIVEDDYDYEYRYGGAPTQALQSMDKHECVIYFGSFWKLLFPLITMHFIVLPKQLIPVFTQAKMLSQRTFSMLEQYALTELIEGGHLERHIRSTKPIYAKRRQALIYALTRHLSNVVKISKESAGMHFLVRFKTEDSDEHILKCAREAGLPLVSTKPFYFDKEEKGEFLAGFAHKPEEELDRSVEQFAKLLS